MAFRLDVNIQTVCPLGWVVRLVGWLFGYPVGCGETDMAIPQLAVYVNSKYCYLLILSLCNKF